MENILKISVGKEEGGAVKSCKNCIHISYTLLSHQHNDADNREGEYMGVKYDYLHRTNFEIKRVCLHRAVL